MTEPLKVDTDELDAASAILKSAAGQIPTQLPQFSVNGSDPLSAAIAAGSAQMEAPMAALPWIQANATTTAENIGVAGKRYRETDETLVGIYLITRSGGQSKDCTSIAALNSYNRQFHDEAASPDHGPTDVEEYRQWARELHRYAAEISDQTLRAKADTVTGLADQYVALLPKLQADLPPDTATQLPSSAPWQEGRRIGGQFNDAVLALAQACPR
jgi:hypothetical protein